MQIQRRRIEAARTTLLLKYPFWGNLALHLTLKESPGLRTTSTDGKYLMFDPEFIEGLTTNEVLGVVVHEVAHCVFGHLWRMGDRERQRWNAACDYAINYLIEYECGLTLPDNALRGFEGESAEQIYPKLLDDQSPWCSSDGWGKGEQIEYDSEFWERATVTAAQVTKDYRGIPSSIKIMIDKAICPKVDWRVLLRDMMQSAIPFNYSLRPNRKHIWRNMYLPSVDKKGVDIVVALDTSGSIGAALLSQFVAETYAIAQICGNAVVHLYSADAEVNNYYEILNADDLPKSFEGGGGTDFRPVFVDVEKRGIEPEVLVYLTDGYGSFPDSVPYQVIWAVVEGGVDTVPFGTRIEIPIHEK